MTQSYTKDEINYTRTINKSEKRKNRLEPGYDRVIPSYVADDRRISGQHRDVYSLIRAVCSRHGCCDIENWEFADFLGISTATFKRYLKKLKDLEYVKIEIFNRYKRKIWMPEAYANRERNSKIFSPAHFCATPAHFCADNNIDINIDIRNNTKKQTTKQTAPKGEPIIFYKAIGNIGITKEEYNQLCNEIGAIALNQTIDSMRKWITDDPSKRRRFSRKDILKKIIKWDKDYQRSPEVRKLEKEIQEKNRAEDNKRKCEENRENNKKILEKYRGNKLFEDKVKIIGQDVLIDCNGLKIHNLNNSGLEKFLEKFLVKEKDSS